MAERRWWIVPANVAVGVGRRLAGAMVGAVMVITFAGMLGPTWGSAIALGWLAAGAATLTQPGERLLAMRVLRYRRAAGSWLAADVHRLAPGRRVDVYVAPQALGVFALGGHTVAVGERSVGDGTRTRALQAATVAAVADLRSGGTRPELALMWWSSPWVVAKMLLGALLPRRWHPFFRILGGGMLAVAVGTCLGQGQPVAAALGVCMLVDLTLAYVSRRRIRAAQRAASPRLVPLTGPAATGS